MTDREIGRELGERQKQIAFDLLETNRADVVLMARRALVQVALATDVATADDVRAVIELPTGMNPKVFGCVPGALARAGIIRRDGYVTTSRREAHARDVSRWAIADRDKAIAWLQTNKPAAPTGIGTAGNSNSTTL